MGIKTLELFIREAEKGIKKASCVGLFTEISTYEHREYKTLRDQWKRSVSQVFKNVVNKLGNIKNIRTL